MADMMTFPPTFEEFIKEYEFIDEKGIYTNKEKLIPSFRVKQAWEYYTSNTDNALDNIRECIRIIEDNLYDIEDTLE